MPSSVGHRRLATLLVPIALTAVLVVPPSSAAPEPATVQTHVVRAGASNPDGGAEPFVYTAYYPDHLQVHPGDLVRWEFLGSYGGWHSVTFLGKGASFPLLVRNDEAPGTLALDEDWIHGHNLGDESRVCGRASWFTVDEPGGSKPCVLGPELLEGPHGTVSSSIWDRFFAMTDSDCEECTTDDEELGGAWTAEVQLPLGTYSYLCKLHPSMRGTIEVVPSGRALANPTPEQVDAQIRLDYASAKAVQETLGAPARAWDATTQSWVVHAGAQTADERVQVLQFLPTHLPDVQRGDRVRFVAGTEEPNTVTFPAGPTVGDENTSAFGLAPRDPLQGGFNASGDCDVDSCEVDPVFSAVGPTSPYGTTGLAFLWTCDYDGAATGASGVPLAYVAPRLKDRVAPFGLSHGCPVVDGRPGQPEMLLSPWMADELRAPGDLISSPETYHNSGFLIPTSVPDAYRADARGGFFPSEFDARFPVAGNFSFICNAHEFMNGSVDVS